MIIKEPPAGATRVTFELVQPGAKQVELAGDFNDWTARLPMEHPDADRWQKTLLLEPGRRYEFRYVVDEGNWLNDSAADGYADNPFGSVNSVVTT